MNAETLIWWPAHSNSFPYSPIRTKLLLLKVLYYITENSFCEYTKFLEKSKRILVIVMPESLIADQFPLKDTTINTGKIIENICLMATERNQGTKRDNILCNF